MHVTVCICTRDRGKSIVDTLRSVLRSRYQDVDIVVVDQSLDDATEQSARAFIKEDPRITYIRSSSIGLSRARNTCLEHARGPLIAFTDDDCEVSSEWLDLIVANFDKHTDVGQICGAVLAGQHDSSLGFIPDYPITVRQRIDSPWQKWRDGGIGANMSFRLSVLQAVGPFDEALGAGEALYTCEDGDMTYRVLRAGYALLELPDAYVIHHGFRTWEQGRVMIRRVGVGVAAAYIKHLRLHDLAVLPTLLIEWWRCISWKRLLLLQRHSGLGRFLGYTRGLVISFRYEIDPQRRIYILSKAHGDQQAHIAPQAVPQTPRSALK